MTQQLSSFETITQNGIQFLSCTSLSEVGYLNAFSLRQGGVSALPKDALNLSDREDDPQHVLENRKRFLLGINAQNYSLVPLKQIHSDIRQSVDSAPTSELEGDALLSSTEKLLLAIQTADCLPVLLGSTSGNFFAGIHAGWKGTLARIVQRTVADVVGAGTVKAKNLIVALGPAACGECYEVGREVVDAFQMQFNDWPEFLHLKDDGKALLDTTEANRIQLRDMGVPEENIFSSSLCTIHNNDLLFSYRKESDAGKKIVGRQMAVIGRK